MHKLRSCVCGGGARSLGHDYVRMPPPSVGYRRCYQALLPDDPLLSVPHISTSSTYSSGPQWLFRPLNTAVDNFQSCAWLATITKQLLTAVILLSGVLGIRSTFLPPNLLLSRCSNLSFLLLLQPCRHTFWQLWHLSSSRTQTPHANCNQGTYFHGYDNLKDYYYKTMCYFSCRQRSCLDVIKNTTMYSNMTMATSIQSRYLTWICLPTCTISF